MAVQVPPVPVPAPAPPVSAPKPAEAPQPEPRPRPAPHPSVEPDRVAIARAEGRSTRPAVIGRAEARAAEAARSSPRPPARRLRRGLQPDPRPPRPRPQHPDRPSLGTRRVPPRRARPAQGGGRRAGQDAPAQGQVDRRQEPRGQARRGRRVSFRSPPQSRQLHRPRSVDGVGQVRCAAPRSALRQRATSSIRRSGPRAPSRSEYVLGRAFDPRASRTSWSDTACLYDLRGWEIIPEFEGRGETYEMTREPISEYARAINRLNPTRATITMWIYPDGFALYRKLRDDLHARGFLVAARPLPEGMAIRGSPAGSLSAGQWTRSPAHRDLPLRVRSAAGSGTARRCRARSAGGGRRRCRRPGRRSGSGSCAGSSGRSPRRSPRGTRRRRAGRRRRDGARAPGPGRTRGSVSPSGSISRSHCINWFLEVQIGRAGQVAGHRDGLVVVENDLEPLGSLQRQDAPAQLALGADQPVVVDHAPRAIDHIDEELPPRPDAEERRLPPGGDVAPVDRVRVVSVVTRRAEENRLSALRLGEDPGLDVLTFVVFEPDPGRGRAGQKRERMGVRSGSQSRPDHPPRPPRPVGKPPVGCQPIPQRGPRPA